MQHPRFLARKNEPRPSSTPRRPRRLMADGNASRQCSATRNPSENRGRLGRGWALRQRSPEFPRVSSGLETPSWDSQIKLKQFQHVLAGGRDSFLLKSPRESDTRGSARQPFRTLRSSTFPQADARILLLAEREQAKIL